MASRCRSRPGACKGTSIIKHAAAVIPEQMKTNREKDNAVETPVETAREIKVPGVRIQDTAAKLINTSHSPGSPCPRRGRQRAYCTFLSRRSTARTPTSFSCPGSASRVRRRGFGWHDAHC
ncbi:hypothetical protein DFP72DRAFT_436963 [Ephemerocybe angulata]|uniref:Uncharacterized protein n=1 Tax=Ephemerocybe angulata TaxID=980116 RepID=A0A8H6HVN0_9AGAR|nr:hypothetical protein DFP72DRAFT_436963 [Tulosesus angulatus]